MEGWVRWALFIVCLVSKVGVKVWVYKCVCDYLYIYMCVSYRVCSYMFSSILGYLFYFLFLKFFKIILCLVGSILFCFKIRLFNGSAIRKFPYRCAIVLQVDMRAASMHLRVGGECILLMSCAF